MLQIQQLLNLPDLSADMESRAKERLAAYRNQFETLLERVREPGSDSKIEKAKEPVRKAAETATRRITKENNWWAWVLKAKSEPDPKKAESIYLEALADFPDDPNLLSHFAIFLTDTLKENDRAEEFFRRAVSLNPTADTLGNLALWLTRAQKSDEAAKLYQKALEMNPNHPRNLSNYAEFVATVLKNTDESLRLFHKAMELAPNDTLIRAEFEKIHGGISSSA
jgi:tetratricopeptide (TPR) repeat protein